MLHKLKLLCLLALAFGLAACDGGSGSGSGSNSAPAASAASAASEGAGNEGGGYAGSIVAESETPDGRVLGGVSVGNSDAPVTVLEYASFTCPHCAEFHENVVTRLKAAEINAGLVRYEFRNYIRDRFDLAVAALVRCQGTEQFFPLLDLFFGRQREWMANYRDPDRMLEDIAAVARRAGISRTRFDQCLADRDLQQHIVEMTQDGQRAWQITSTPTVIVNGEKRGVEALTYEGLAEIIEQES